MAREYCPKCGKDRNVVVTVWETEETKADGSVCRERTESVHCESCGAFIRSAVLADGSGD